MQNLNEILKTIETFNNSVITSVDFANWGTVVKFEASDFAAAGIISELNIKPNKNGNNYMFVTMAKNTL